MVEAVKWSTYGFYEGALKTLTELRRFRRGC